MPEKHQSLLDTVYLRSVWAKEYESFKNSPESQSLLTRLKNWADRDRLKETASESAFIDIFFKQTWGYHAVGETEKERGYTLQQQFPVKGAGQKGGTGEADIALGYFGLENREGIPQVLGEFKDDRSGLDKPQTTRANDRSPVDQCLDYLRESRGGLISTVLPTWGLVTDMNEFRLYIYGDKARYQRFVISPGEGDPAISLLGDEEEAAFQRFLFFRILHCQWLLTTSGKSGLEKLVAEQITHEQALENEFYAEYHAFREEFYQTLRQYNPQYEQEGRLRRLVRFTQRILDRCLFILYCEDMGRELNFPPNVLRDVLIEVGNSKYFDSEAPEAWTRVKRLFAAMRDGTSFGSERINKFNGGLFKEDPELDALIIPNRLFCQQNQGQTPERLLRFPNTLLYFSAKYNFGTADDGRGRTLTLTAMGRIFEQSITDLELMEAHAEGRPSLTELTKRKRDGVYYTPEWVTHYIVEQTVGTKLAEIRKEIGFERFANVTDEQIEAYYTDRRKARVVGEYEAVLLKYRVYLDEIKVVDPACGSGAFLIQAFRFLYDQRQWIAKELERVTGAKGIFDTHSAMSEVLSKNLYGLDINAESVELTRLALWLHSVLPNRPLTALDHNIRCGNSLIGHDFYRQMAINRDLFAEDEQERVNTFGWEEAFPEVFQRDNPGFDCVIGNPPYVKLQHFRKVQADIAEYLVQARREGGGPMFESTQTGNFDMYLPFIERGIELLNRQGRMGYIAPNVWMVNEYGKGLRGKLKRTRSIDRWIDFKSFQVFEEAITYTALQFFTGRQQERIRCVFAPNGNKDITGLVWDEVSDAVQIDQLPDEDSWLLMPDEVRKLHAKLSESCNTLEENCRGITVGIQTSADYIYHLERLGANRYLHKPKGKKEPVEVEIEDEIMHPLVSGTEANRYQVPVTSTYLLHPYQMKSEKVSLISQREFEKNYPKAWQYLLSYEDELRARERSKMNRDDSWWAYNYPKNLDKQELPKLMVPRLVINLFTAVDSKGEFYLDNVDVNGILVNDSKDLFFLAGLLNAPIANFLWRWISKPFQNDYRSANKQFIAPLPIPKATVEEKAEVAGLAEKLQNLHTRRRDLMLMIDKRMDSAQCENDARTEEWLWSDVKSMAAFKKEAPGQLKGRELKQWATSQRESRLTSRLDTISPFLNPGINLTVTVQYGELKLMADGIPLLEGIFLEDGRAAFIAAQWRQKIRKTNITEKFDAKRLLNLLLKLHKTENTAIMKQVTQIDKDILALDSEIDQAETVMNRLTYRLYNLTEEEILLVES